MSTLLTEQLNTMPAASRQCLATLAIDVMLSGILVSCLVSWTSCPPAVGALAPHAATV